MSKTICNAIVITAVLLMAAVVAMGQNADPTGMVCISPVPKSNSDPVSLGNPAGGNRSFDYTIQIGSKKVAASTEKTGRFEDLPLNKTHVVKIYRDGKQVSSFRFRFEKKGSNQLCLWYKALYEAWSLWPLKDSKGKCSCK